MDRAGKKIRCEFTPGPEYQGFQGITHGGVITTLLDEAMVKLAFELGIPAVTAWIEVRFLTPLMTGEKTYISAGITKEGKKLIEASAEAVTTDGKTIAKATGKMIRVNPPSHTTSIPGTAVLSSMTACIISFTVS